MPPAVAHRRLPPPPTDASSPTDVSRRCARTLHPRPSTGRRRLKPPYSAATDGYGLSLAEVSRCSVVLPRRRPASKSPVPEHQSPSPSPSTPPPTSAKRWPEPAKFQIAPLDSEDKMRIIFDARSVTNEHARVPGESSQLAPIHVSIEEDVAGSGCEGLGFDTTSIGDKSVNKRTTGYSPSPDPSKKRHDNDTSSCMQHLLDIYEKGSQNSVTSFAPVIVDPVRAKTREMMALVEKDGAEEGSDKHFYATQFLRYKEWRDFFITLKTPCGRLAWLKRRWEAEQKKL